MTCGAEISRAKRKKGRSLTTEWIGRKRATLLKISLSLGRNADRSTPLQTNVYFMPRRSDTCQDFSFRAHRNENLPQNLRKNQSVLRRRIKNAAIKKRIRQKSESSPCRCNGRINANRPFELFGRAGEITACRRDVFSMQIGAEHIRDTRNVGLAFQGV